MPEAVLLRQVRLHLLLLARILRPARVLRQVRILLLLAQVLRLARTLPARVLRLVRILLVLLHRVEGFSRAVERIESSLLHGAGRRQTPARFASGIITYPEHHLSILSQADRTRSWSGDGWGSSINE